MRSNPVAKSENNDRLTPPAVQVADICLVSAESFSRQLGGVLVRASQGVASVVTL